jgi:hypothetical protein
MDHQSEWRRDRPVHYPAKTPKALMAVRKAIPQETLQTLDTQRQFSQGSKHFASWPQEW